MLTIVESPLFSRLWPDYWTEEELGEFCAFLVLLVIYAKSARENIPAHVLRKIAEEMSDAPS